MSRRTWIKIFVVKGFMGKEKRGENERFRRKG